MPRRATTSPARSPSSGSRLAWVKSEEMKLEAFCKQHPIGSSAQKDSDYWKMAAHALGTNRTPEAVCQHWSKLCKRRAANAPVSAWTRLKRTSVPLEWRALAEQHPFYLISSTFYAIAGLFMGYVERGRPHALLGEPIIWILQTIFTHMSDVATLGEDSIWHAVDRLHAYTFTVLRATYTLYAFYAWKAYSPTQAAVFGVGLTLAMCCIRLSWMAVMRRDPGAFLRWHALWHLSLPATALCVGLLFQ